MGGDPASKLYVGSKTRAFKRLDLISETFNYPATISEAELLGVIDKLNADPRFHGILVQLPLPGAIDSNRVLLRVDPLKDVTGSTLPIWVCCCPASPAIFPAPPMVSWQSWSTIKSRWPAVTR